MKTYLTDDDLSGKNNPWPEPEWRAMEPELLHTKLKELIAAKVNGYRWSWYSEFGLRRGVQAQTGVSDETFREALKAAVKDKRIQCTCASGVNRKYFALKPTGDAAKLKAKEEE